MGRNTQLQLSGKPSGYCISKFRLSLPGFSHKDLLMYIVHSQSLFSKAKLKKIHISVHSVWCVCARAWMHVNALYVRCSLPLFRRQSLTELGVHCFSARWAVQGATAILPSLIPWTLGSQARITMAGFLHGCRD